jgi:hypothetical protein
LTLRSLWLLCRITYLIDLSSEGATLRDPGLSTGGSAESHIAAKKEYRSHGQIDILSAEDSGLGMGEDGGDLKASGALHIQEITVGGLNQSLQLMSCLLLLRSGVKQIDLHDFQKRNAKRMCIG